MPPEMEIKSASATSSLPKRPVCTITPDSLPILLGMSPALSYSTDMAAPVQLEDSYPFKALDI